MQRKQNNKNTSLSIPKNMKLGIVVSEFNSDITFKLLEGTIKTLTEAGANLKNIIVRKVPGGFEIPLACDRLIKKNKVKGVVAIGCVIRGDTDHYVYIANEATRGVMDVMLKREVPIANAILTVNNLEQAKIRSEGEMNKGIEAGKALLSMLQ